MNARRHAARKPGIMARLVQRGARMWSSWLPGWYAAPIHPLTVHFPIALWIIATAALIASLGGSEAAHKLGATLVHLGALSAVIACTAGWLASEAVGHDSPGHDMVHDHRNLMLVASGIGIVASALAFWWRRQPSRAQRGGLAGIMVVVCLIMMFGADRGANLVYGHGVGVRGRADAPSRPGVSDDAVRLPSGAASVAPSRPAPAPSPQPHGHGSDDHHH